MAEQRTLEEICAEAVEFITIVGGMTEGTAGKFINGRAEGFRREMARAAPDRALTAALDKVDELQKLADERAAIIIAGEAERGHLRQCLDLLNERLGALEGGYGFSQTTVAEPASTAEPSPTVPDAPNLAEQAEPALDPAAETSPTGLSGRSARSQAPRRYRLYDAGDASGVRPIDEGTAGELCTRNDISPATLYKLARSGKPGARYRVDEITDPSLSVRRTAKRMLRRDDGKVYESSVHAANDIKAEGADAQTTTISAAIRKAAEGSDRSTAYGHTFEYVEEAAR